MNSKHINRYNNYIDVCRGFLCVSLDFSENSNVSANIYLTPRLGLNRPGLVLELLLVLDPEAHIENGGLEPAMYSSFTGTLLYL